MMKNNNNSQPQGGFEWLVLLTCIMIASSYILLDISDSIHPILLAAIGLGNSVFVTANAYVIYRRRLPTHKMQVMDIVYLLLTTTTLLTPILSLTPAIQWLATP